MIVHHKASDLDLFATAASHTAAGTDSTGLRRYLRGLLARFQAARAARATYDTLSQLSDRELADIGLHRAELPDLVLEHRYGSR